MEAGEEKGCQAVYGKIVIKNLVRQEGKAEGKAEGKVAELVRVVISENYT
jgi:hypothetical protein